MAKKDIEKLLGWYQDNKRPLPWRKTKNPYRIWISETMLQQTTATAVIPYYKRFLKRFPSLKSLAQAEESDVLEMWAGLGYYSRARNLLKAAKALAELGSFPHSYLELIQLPGFGPYTARAVSSLSFDEAVGVLDGNVIRILSRKENCQEEWWKPKGRQKLQDLADKSVQGFSSHDVNQSLMELGATICLAKNPKCLLCPWSGRCQAQKLGLWSELPLRKPKKAREHWLWRPQLYLRNNKIALIKNNYAPFLRGQWIPPGVALKRTTKPKTYDFKHSITHHNIFVCATKANYKLKKDEKNTDIKWVDLKKISQVVPASLVKKAIELV